MPSPRFHMRRRIRTPDPRLLSDGRYRSPSPPLDDMPSPRVHMRRLIRTKDPRLLSDGRYRSPSPPLDDMPSPRVHMRRRIRTPDPRLPDGRYRSPSPPLDDEEVIIAQIVVMFAMEDPAPDPVAVEFLLHEVKAVGLPFHVIFNKIDLVEPEVISQWESHLLRWGGYTASFVSLHSHLGLHDLDNVLSGKSSLVVGLHNVGKTSLVDHVRKNRATDARFDLCTVIRKADKWLTQKCDASNVLKEDKTENPSLHPFCIDLYKDTNSGNDAFLVRPKGWIIQKLLESDPPILDDMVQWVSRMEKTEEYLYFTKYCPENERSWWRNLTGKDKEVCSLKKKLEKDYQRREVMDQLLVKLYKACFEPCQHHEEMLRELLRLVNDSPKLCRDLAHGAAFLATAVTLMLVGQEATKIATAHLLRELADTHYPCKVLIGELGGFHVLAEMIQSGSASVRKAAIQTVCVLVAAEENWRKVLVTGVPEAVVGMLAEDGEDAVPLVSKTFNLLGSFELAWKRFFTAAHESLNTSTCLYNAVMKALLRIKHVQDLRVEYLEGSVHCERDNESLEVEGLSEC